MKKQPRKFLLYLTALWLGLILTLGTWWLYLIIDISSRLNDFIGLSGSLEKELDYLKLAQYEGAAFVFLILLTSTTLFYLYFQDIKKNQSLTSFFASLTHELKTPLASMRLQAEVLQETVEELEKESKPVKSMAKLTQRLIQDAQRLENEMDNILQLSRIERGGSLNLRALDVNEFLLEEKRKRENTFALRIEGEVPKIMADEFALTLILRNLIQNTIKHAKKNEAIIKVSSQGGTTQISYSDQTPNLKVDLKKLGKLFHKEGDSTGSGVGLYLIKKLSFLMNGDFKIHQDEYLNFILELVNEE